LKRHHEIQYVIKHRIVENNQSVTYVCSFNLNLSHNGDIQNACSFHWIPWFFYVVHGMSAKNCSHVYTMYSLYIAHALKKLSIPHIPICIQLRTRDGK